jgi:hypothetical protein
LTLPEAVALRRCAAYDDAIFDECEQVIDALDDRVPGADMSD